MGLISKNNIEEDISLYKQNYNTINTKKWVEKANMKLRNVK